MFEADDIRDWIDREIVDEKGSKIGKVESYYYDTASDVPAFASVKTGMIGRQRLIFVPLGGARVSPGHLRVLVPKKLATSSPSIDPDGELESTEEPAIFEHYGLAYQPGSGGERRLGRR